MKSLGGIRLSSARVMEKGLQYDRRWMLVDEQGKFLTQRAWPQMALFKLRQEGDGFAVSFQEESLSLPRSVHGESFHAQIWDDSVEVVLAPEVYHQWFSDRLGLKCRLVNFPEKNQRPVDHRYRLANENVSLADGYPLLIIGQASLDDLNARLEKPVPMNRFRPNLVFSGGAPYEEDQWRKFSVGSNSFMGVKPCSRCVLTTVDQTTGEVGREPLLTLSKYRRFNEKINFGQNVIPINCHEIHEGDEISVD